MHYLPQLLLTLARGITCFIFLHVVFYFFFMNVFTDNTWYFIFSFSKESCSKFPCGVSIWWWCSPTSEACIFYLRQVFCQTGSISKTIPNCTSVCYCIYVPFTSVGDDSSAHIHTWDTWTRISSPHGHYASLSVMFESKLFCLFLYNVMSVIYR